MRKKLISIAIALTMVFSCLACSVTNVDFGNGNGGPSVNVPADPDAPAGNSLQVLKSDVKLTQDQTLSRIKAEYLIENNGYKPGDEVVAVLTLPQDAVIDTYLGRTRSVELGEYAAGEARAQVKAIDAAQSALVSELKKEKLISSVENSYSTILNGVAVKTTYGAIEKLEAHDGIESVILSDTFNRPQTVEGGNSASSIENPVDVYDTGIFNSSSVSYTGKNTAVAVLDSGFDCSHSVFDRTLDASQLWLTQQDISSKLSQTNAIKTTRDLDITDVWYSNKIPFVYDYADKDDDVFPYDSEHGTHVAGIIGGKDSVITGVAIDTQLVLMKVFPDHDDGAKTDDILAALEDAVLLGVDCINMSLGSSCGFTREEDGNKINDVYDKINDSGISILTAASNSYSSAFGGEQGNTNKVTNPDSSTVGSPSTYRTALSVASISGVKSRYLVGNDELVVFFSESNSIAGKPNDFVAELDANPATTLGESGTRVFEYVTVPGYGERSNYQSVDVTGKIALVRRGSNTFEDKALRAKNAGAVACIIYNNVEGDISMSMGKSDHIPTISITKELGTILASREGGTFTISRDNQAGPFMSDFSSWGPSPDLELKPEITAHGGTIKSSVPGGDYDELSGTSMATPNLCGLVVLIRQFLKEKFPDYTQQQIVVLANQMLMSTASIVLNEEGNPYSPRKQGAGLASLYNVVNTKAYLSVDGIDRTKLELKDDPEKTGVYTMNFNVVNISDQEVKYDLSLVGMSESVSTSDSDYVAEKGRLLSNGFTAKVEGEGSLKGGVVTVSGNGTAKVSLTYKLTAADKAYIDSSFPNGMFVEGFVKLAAKADDDIDLNVPFLAFYGDWTKAPIFDKTYYEVETEAHDGSIDDEDKLKADYFATTPYGSYFYNYIIPLGTYLYDIDPDYDYIPATEEHIAIGAELATIDGISSVYGGLLRNAKTMKYTITDKLTGEVVKEFIDYNANKAYSLGGAPMPYYEYLNWKTRNMPLINNREYEFKMTALLDYGDGGLTTNLRNTFDFDFYFDTEAPVIKEATYEKTYDTTLKKDRYYINLTIYDNHYAQSITPLVFTSSSSYAILTENPIPIYSEKGKDNNVRIEITDYLDDIYNDAIITSALCFQVDDYALNSQIYICQLPGTRGEFKFTRNGEIDGSALTILTVDEGEIVDLTAYLATSDNTVDENKDYLKHLVWSSSNEDIAKVERGQVLGVKEGRATVSVTEAMDLRKATLLINVRKKPTDTQAETVSEDKVKGSARSAYGSGDDVDDVSSDTVTVESLRFDYFDTTFAYSRAAQTSEIGRTGGKIMLSGVGSRVSMYPGERIKLSYDLQPWYVADKYQLRFESSNTSVASVNPNTGDVTALKRGSATITLRLYAKDASFDDPDNLPQPVSNLMARLPITVNSEFVIDNRTLVAYKGYGDENGRVIIPDDEGILYIGAFAFCLYDTDNTIEAPEDDLDANKIPSTNTSIKSVVVPDGVEDIQKYAFYNCPGLESVELPDSVKYVREYAFYGDERLERINLDKVSVIGANAFKGCKKLDNVDLTKAYAIGANAFDGCEALSSVDLTALRNAGSEAFKDCKALESVTLTEYTKLSEGMFARSGLTSVDVYERITVPRFCFAQCSSLVSVKLHNDVVTIGYGAFCQNDLLSSVTMKGVSFIDEQAFYDCPALEEIELPNSPVKIGNYAFRECDNLKKIKLGANTVIDDVTGIMLKFTNVTQFEIASGNAHYAVSSDGRLLTSKDGKTVILAAAGYDFGNYTIDGKYVEIGSGAFSGTNIVGITITNADTVVGAYSFAGCDKLETVTLPSGGVKSIGDHAFRFTDALKSVVNLDKVKTVGMYAFAQSGLPSASVGANADYGEGAFFNSEIVTVTIGEGAHFESGAFQSCRSLTRVNMPAGGGVHFGTSCFANDSSLEYIDLSKHDEIIEREAFYGCSSLVRVDLANVKEVGDFAFADCSSVTVVLIPKVERLGEGAFARYDQYGGAPMIQAIDLPETLTEVGDGAFLGCEALLEITLPSSLKEVGDYMFAYAARLVNVTLPSTVTRIGTYAFAGCERLININVDEVEEIADYAFTSAAALSKVDLSSAVTIGYGAFAQTGVEGDIVAPELVSVGDYAFQNAWLDSFTAKKLAEIGVAAFENNRRLEKFVFSTALERIGETAFHGCAGIKNYYFERDGEEVLDGVINDYAMLADGVLYTKLDRGDYMLSSVPAAKDITELVVSEGTRSIMFYAGNENKNIEKIVLPDSLKSIGNYAFYGYNNLKTVEFRSYTAPKLEDVYIRDASLSESDPGYDLLHNQFGLFDYELCYYTFIDLVGKKEPIEMILPANANVKGYDSIVYQAFFGKVDDAKRSNYLARDEFFVNFIEYVDKLSKIETLSFGDEELVDNAISALNGMKQDPTKYGYTKEEWTELVNKVYAARDTLDAMRSGRQPVTPPSANDPMPAWLVVLTVVLCAAVAGLIVWSIIVLSKLGKDNKEEQ